jgi:hypothetical protein
MIRETSVEVQEPRLSLDLAQIDVAAFKDG